MIAATPHDISFRGPALGRDAALAGVDTDGDMSGEGLGGLAHEVGVFDGDGAEDDAGKALFQPHGDGGHVTDAAAKLGGDLDCFQDGFDGGGVDRLAGESAVQVDEVEPLTSGSLELQGLGGGVVAEDGGR